MLFGTSIYKINKLNAQHQQTNVNLRLARAKKTIKNAQSAWTAEKNYQINQIRAGKKDFIDMCMATAITAEEPAATATADEKIAYQKAYTEALSQANADWTSYSASAIAAIESDYEETNSESIQAAMQEEEDLTIEASYWKEMVDFWGEMIKQAEDWFRESLRDMFGGGHGR